MRNHLVNFKVCDVYHPDPNRLLQELHGDDLLQGRIVEVSRGNPPESNFAVVQVDGLRSVVIVSLERLREVV